MNNIKRKRRQVQHDLNTLAAYFGIDPSKSKPMDVFITVKQFLNDLATATENLSKIAVTRKNSSRAMMRSVSTPSFKRSSRNSSFRGSRNNSARSSRNSSARSSFRRSHRSQSFGSNASDATSGSQEFNDSIMFGEGRSRTSSKSSSSEIVNMNFDVDISESRTSTMSKSDKEEFMVDSTYSTMSSKGSLKQRSTRRVKEQAWLNEEREREREKEPDLSKYKDLIKKWEEEKSNGTRDALRNRRANEKKSPGKASEEFMRKQEQIEKVLLSPVREKPERKREGTPDRKQNQDTEMADNSIQMKEIGSTKAKSSDAQQDLREKDSMSRVGEKTERKENGIRREVSQQAESQDTGFDDGGLQMKEIRSSEVRSENANLGVVERTAMPQIREKLERKRERNIEQSQQEEYHENQGTDIIDDGFQSKKLRPVDGKLERKEEMERTDFEKALDENGSESIKKGRKEETRMKHSKMLLDETRNEGFKKERKEETRMNHSKMFLDEKENKIIEDDSYYDKDVIGDQISRVCLESPRRSEIRMDREPDLSKYRHLVKSRDKRPRPSLMSKGDNRQNEGISGNQQELENKRSQEESNETPKSRSRDRPTVSIFDREKHERFRNGDKSVFVKKVRSKNAIESTRENENCMNVDEGMKSSAQSVMESNHFVNGERHAKEAAKFVEEKSEDKNFSGTNGFLKNQKLKVHSEGTCDNAIQENPKLDEVRNGEETSRTTNGGLANSNSHSNKAIDKASETLDNLKSNSSNFKRGGNRNSFSRGRNSFRNSFKADHGPKKVSVKAMQARDIPKSNSLSTSMSDLNFANTKRRRTKSEGIQAVVLKPGFIAKNMPMKLEIKPVDPNNNEIEQNIENKTENGGFKSVDDDSIMLQTTDPPVLRRTKSAVIRRNIREAKIIFFL